MRRISILLIVLLVVGLSVCKRPEPKYGKEYNEERKKVGLPIIPDNWELSSVLTGESVWANPERVEKKNKNIPVHWRKRLNYRTGTLISETDTYYGKEDFPDQDGTSREHLYITYNYQVDDYDYKKRADWSASLYNRETVASGDFDISLEEAEKILKDWGIERLSYEFPSKD